MSEPVGNDIDDSVLFLDTNAVIRYLTGIPVDLVQRARQIIEGHATLTVTDVVVAETSFILIRQMGIPRANAVDALTGFLERENIRTHGSDKSFVIAGLNLCRPSSRVSIPDALIWAAARSAGADALYTLDRRFPTHGLVVRQL